jgi:hypothetical protein
MKRKIIASLLGIAGSLALVASSHGQGTVFFLNYASDVNAPVTFGKTASAGGVSGTAGVNVGSEFTAALEYSLDGGTTYTLLSQAAAGAGGAYPTAFLSTDGNTANGAGYFNGPIVTIPGYSSGPISFIVEAYHGSSYAAAVAANDWAGKSNPFTLSSIATGTTQTGDLVGMPAFVVTVPEPSVFALAGLGAAGLMALRRKKA